MLPQGKDYSTFNPKRLTSKPPWSTPSPVSYGRRDHGALGQPSKFPHGTRLSRYLTNHPNTDGMGCIEEKGRAG